MSGLGESPRDRTFQERDVHSKIDIAAFSWQESPVSETPQETESSGAREMWDPQGLRPQALGTVLEVLECQVFQNLTPESCRVVGPRQHFKPPLYLDIAPSISSALAKSLHRGLGTPIWRPQGPLLA